MQGQPVIAVVQTAIYNGQPVILMRVIFSFALLFSMLSIKAQTFNIDQLIGGKWMEYCVVDNDTLSKDKSIEFSAKYMKFTDSFDEEAPQSTSHYYYLSPTIPKTFDFTKVGKKTSGKYIVIYEEFNALYYLEIKVLTKDYLRLYDDVWGNVDESLREDVCYQKYKHVK